MENHLWVCNLWVFMFCSQGGEHCYYQGKVRDVPRSFVALSTCQGLQWVQICCNVTSVLLSQHCHLCVSRSWALLPFIYELSIISLSQPSPVSLHFESQVICCSDGYCSDIFASFFFFSVWRCYFQGLCSKAALSQRSKSKIRPADTVVFVIACVMSFKRGEVRVYLHKIHRTSTWIMWPKVSH